MKNTKILVISDDIRNPSGVGIQCKKLLEGLLKKGVYDIVEIAGSLVPQSPNPVMFNGIKLYPTSDGYGNSTLLRNVIKAEKPEIIILFSDPRFFQYVFMIDNEIRDTAKLIFYHTWDNEPFPKYNLPWYSTCDKIVMISQFSHDLLANNNVPCECIQHGMDPSEFYPLPEEEVVRERQQIIQLTGRQDIDFIVLWNNRNMARKRGADVIDIFRKFVKIHPKSLLFMHTNSYDPEGTNLLSILNDVNPIDSSIIMSSKKVTSNMLNILYNVADVTLNIAYNEGFGLSVAESLCAGTPVIATKTGGMTEQMTDGTDEFGRLLTPDVRTLYGFPPAPYIYADYVSTDAVVNALDDMYNRKKELPTIGNKGRDYIIQNFHIDDTVNKWHKLLQKVISSPITFKKWNIL